MADVTRDEFARGLEDALVIIERLAPHCAGIDELIGLIKPAVTDDDRKGNGAQVKLLMNVVLPPAGKERR